MYKCQILFGINCLYENNYIVKIVIFCILSHNHTNTKMKICSVHKTIILGQIKNMIIVFYQGRI